MKDISLIGFMGCGKSSVGRVLATLLPDCRLIDLDSYIEERQGMSIPDIFNEYGEAAFRRMEREALEEIFSEPDRPRTILSLGGGTVTSEACGQLIRRHTDCFYLHASTDTLVSNLEGHSEGRPMLSSAQPSACADASPGPTTDETAKREPLVKEEALRNRIESLMQNRSPQYEATSHHIIDTDGQTFAQTAALILKAVENSQ